MEYIILNGLSNKGKIFTNEYLKKGNNILNINLDYILNVIKNRIMKDNNNLNYEKIKEIIILGIEEYEKFYRTNQEYIILDMEDSKKEFISYLLKDFVTVINIENIGNIENDYFDKSLNKLNFGNNIEINCSNNFNYLFCLNNLFIKKRKYLEELKTPDKFVNIPEKFRETIDNIYKKLFKSDFIDFMLVTGSGNRGCVIEGWSDIDLILVVKENNDQNIRNEISKIVNNHVVKVGTTVYSKVEFESAMIDLKTMSALFDVWRGAYVPSICNEDLLIPYVTIEDLSLRIMQTLPNYLHDMRRNTYPNVKFNGVKNIKDYSHTMRVLLWLENIYPIDYGDVNKKFTDTYGIKYFDSVNFIKSFVENHDWVAENKEEFMSSMKELLDLNNDYTKIDKIEENNDEKKYTKN